MADDLAKEGVFHSSISFDVLLSCFYVVAFFGFLFRPWLGCFWLSFVIFFGAINLIIIRKNIYRLQLI